MDDGLTGADLAEFSDLSLAILLRRCIRKSQPYEISVNARRLMTEAATRLEAIANFAVRKDGKYQIFDEPSQE